MRPPTHPGSAPSLHGNFRDRTPAGRAQAGTGAGVGRRLTPKWRNAAG